MKKRRGLVNRGGSRKSRHQIVPLMERVEDRVLMAVFTVTSTSDTANATAGDGSLRGEILASNLTTTANTIDFSLPTGAQTIALVAPLPVITDSLIIDGTSQAGFSNAPLIQISGKAITLTGAGITIQAAGSGLSDLIIDNFNGDGVDLFGGTDFVEGCYIGTNAAGSAIAANTGVGILVGSPNNTIGAIASNPNVISGNTIGILVNGSTSTGNSIVHNYVGTDATGKVARGNWGTSGLGSGVELDAGGNTIGGLSLTGPLGVGNLISGNDAQILVNGSTASGNVIQGNYLSTDITGTTDIDSNPGTTSEGAVGIFIQGAANTTVGGTTQGDSNTIVNGVGVSISGSASTGNIIRHNFIGVGSNGFTPVGNITTGVLINGASQNQVGGTDQGGTIFNYGNVIANWSAQGVEVIGGTGDAILSNSIYSTKVLSDPAPNNNVGILLSAANAGVKAPTITSAQSGAGQTQVTGTFSGNKNTQYRIQFFSSPQGNPNGFGDGQTFVGDLDIITNSQGTRNFSTRLTTLAPVGFVLTATATQDVLVLNNTSEFSKSVQIIQAPVADLALTSTLPSTGPLFRQPYTFTLTVTNNGPNDATGVVLTDTLPTNSTFTSATASNGTVGTVTSGVYTDNIGTITNGSTVTVTITINPTGLGSFTNTAIVTSDDIDPNTANNTSSFPVGLVVVPDADLSVVLTPSVSESPVGSPLTYTLSVGNNGPSVATNTMVTVQFPADFTNFVVMPDQGSYTVNADNSVTVNLGIVPASSAINVVFTVTPTAVESAVTTATVFTMPPVADPNPNNNVTSATVIISNAADLGVTLSANPNPGLVGQDLIYTAVVTNNGPSAASEPVLTDTLPAGVTFDPANSSAENGTLTFANGVVTASFGALLNGDSDTVNIAVIPSASTLVTNSVVVGDPGLTNPVEIDPDLSNNVATLAVPISPADVGVTVNNPADPLLIGQDALFLVVVDNYGPTDATNVRINDTFSSGTIVSVSNGGFNGSNYGVILGSLPSGQQETISIIIDPTVSGSLTSSATVSADQFDTDPGNNMASSSNLVSPADLSVAVAGSPVPILFGQSLLYVVTVTNNGPAPATNVTFNDSLPGGAYFQGLVASQGSVAPEAGFGSISGNLGTLAAGASATVTIAMLPFETGSFTDTAASLSDDFDPNLANNIGSFGIQVINLPGTIDFAQSIQSVPENAGYTVLLVQRTGGTLGAVSVNYATQDFTAVAGVNYVASAGTLTFQAGQSYAAIIIPVLDDFKVDGNLGFFVALSSPTNGASLGTQGVEGVVVLNTDRDLVPPAITSLLAIPNGNQIDGFALTFDKAMDPTRASLLSNYYVFLTSGGAVNQGTPVALAAAEYNPSNDTVILVPTVPLPSNRFYEVLANGSVGTALTDVSGNLLYGSSGPNSNYVAYYGQGTNLTYQDAQDNSVNLQLSGGGIMGIYRGSNGDASLVNLYGIVPHSTKLSGSVKKLGKDASGHTYIGAINGFGQFGDVKSTLTTPQFYVGSAPISASSVGAGVPVPLTVSAESVTSPTVTAKKATPKGPHHARR
jgi:uncharacterized repeat protein (TIGR01451 family)